MKAYGIPPKVARKILKQGDTDKDKQISFVELHRMELKIFENADANGEKFFYIF